MTLIRRPDRMTIGFELPLDNDWSPAGVTRRIADGRPGGVPDLSATAELVRKADDLGFAAVWVRDVPVFDMANFGDAGSVHDIFTLLGYLAGITRRIALGTAAVVLPLRHPLMIAKAAASADVLSGGRLILGVASGDRPVEYPLLGLNFEGRGQAFRTAVEYLREAWQPGGLPIDGGRSLTLDLLPRPAQRRIPMVVAGQAQQTTAWLAGQMDGRFTYPMGVERTAQTAQTWAEATAGQGALLSAFFLDLLDDPDAPIEPIRLGARGGRNAIIAHFRALFAAGVDHVAVNLRQSGRPVSEAMDELAAEIVPLLTKPE
jgi:luciferase-type oxidoreductase